MADINKIYSHQNVRYTHRRKLYRVSDVFEEGYNELINVAINLALTCIAQNAKRIKSVLAYSFGCVVFSLEALISVWPAYLLCLRLLVALAA